jgi:hypothetical protein
MILKALPAVTAIAIVGLAVQVEAQAPCPELLRLRNAATDAWQQAMKGPPSERCGALYHAALAAQAHSSTQITIASHAIFPCHC